LGNKIVSLNRGLIEQQGDSLYMDELARMHQEPLGSFYHSFSLLQEYHSKFSNNEPENEFSIVKILAKGVPDVSFSGVEVFGKYLDLQEQFIVFCELMKKINIEQDYLQYLDRFSSFFYIPESVKQTKPYLDYLHSLWEYLFDFYKRVNPLVSVDIAIEEWDREFNRKCETGEIQLLRKKVPDSAPQPLRLGMFGDPTELEALGLDRLKDALEALGLKCGGTLRDRALRLWSVRGKSADEIPEKLKSKPKNTTDLLQERSIFSSFYLNSYPFSQIRWLEFKIASISELMGDIVSASRRHAEKQQALSVEEKEHEIFEEEYGISSADKKTEEKDEDEDSPIYNPLNLPLGFDGRPIPFWLYKLHGLGVEYKCEICGNQSYWGRRAFDRHFQEWKHSYGMRCLGVPNTKHFHDITSIDDVLTLYHKIKDQLKQDQYTADDEEEFEDTHGNILTRRTYEDLARQGLL
jgi:splicing factor 3A subunit 3